MNRTKRTWITIICIICCMMCMNMAVFASESISNTTESTENNSTMTYDISLKNWNRRIYDLSFNVREMDSDAEAIRIYAGIQYHLTDSYGDVLEEGMYIDADGNVTADTKGGLVSRDLNGWYVLWSKPDYDKMSEQHIYVQANVTFVGGNNKHLSVAGLSGLYQSKEDAQPIQPMAFEDIVMNVATEVDISDTEVPIMSGMNVETSAFLYASAVKMTAVYGDLRDIPMAVQWYHVSEGADGTKVETPVGEPMTQMPYHVPSTEYHTIASKNTEYLVKVFYTGEPSTAEAKKNTNGHENAVSDTEAIDQASYRTELVKGRIDIDVMLKRLPYHNDTSATKFSYRLYRFDQPNQVIQGYTPYTVYTVTFEKGGTQLVQHLSIEGLDAGWYTLVPETPYSDFVEIADERWDNRGKDGRIGSSAGVDFSIGQIVENKYSWEMIRYQGQDTKDSVGDNHFKVTYKYNEALFGVTYDVNAPKGAKVSGNVPVDTSKYREGSKVTVQSGSHLKADGWQFAGWSLEANDGQYFSNDVLYSDQSVHGISVNKQVSMIDGGVTLYAKWIPVYEVNYHGNTSTGGTLPIDTKGTAASGSNLYYDGDMITVQAPGKLKKQDSDGVKYEFVGWSTNWDGSGVRYYEGDRIFIEGADVTLYAQWKAIGTDKFSVNYIAVLPKEATMLGQTPVDSEKYAAGNVVKVMGRGTMSVMHYRFAGWALASNEDGLYVDGEEIFGTHDIGETVTREETVMKEQGLSFYSRWIPLYQVIYHADVKSGLPEDSNEYEAGDSVTILAGEDMERPGYTFIGWNTEEDGSGQAYEDGAIITMEDNNLELFAQWEKVPESVTETEHEKPDSTSGGIGTVPLVILAIIGTACVTACVVYNIMRRRDNE